MYRTGKPVAHLTKEFCTGKRERSTDVAISKHFAGDWFLDKVAAERTKSLERAKEISKRTYAREQSLSGRMENSMEDARERRGDETW